MTPQGKGKPDFAENKRPTPTLLALDKLVRLERHSLLQARHHKCVRDAQQGEVLAESQVLCVQKHDGLVGEAGKTRVDARESGAIHARKAVAPTSPSVEDIEDEEVGRALGSGWPGGRI
jgi:hypothetical protein